MSIFAIHQISAMDSITTIVLDAGPLIQNAPSVSSLLAMTNNIFTVPSVLTEIRDINTRSRVENTLRPFLTVRAPSEQSIKFVSGFARRTGDLSVLSQTDIEILALAYELECERNGGDGKLRASPGQRQTNECFKDQDQTKDKNISHSKDERLILSEDGHANQVYPVSPNRNTEDPNLLDGKPQVSSPEVAMSTQMQSLAVEDPGDTEEVRAAGESNEPTEESSLVANQHEPKFDEEDASSDSEGWITPSNIKKHLLTDSNTSAKASSTENVSSVVTLTTDFAMQNVLLQIGLNLISPSLQRIRNIRSYILRCHACFQQVKDRSKQFCPRCGKPTLTRVSCSTNSKGEFQIHLKKNMQWNHRGDRYSIPKPVHGSASGKVGKGNGGGKQGWGQGLILAEDQKEYERAIGSKSGKGRAVDLMDADYLPGGLTGERLNRRERPKIGAGRNVNSKRRL